MNKERNFKTVQKLFDALHKHAQEEWHKREKHLYLCSDEPNKYKGIVCNKCDDYFKIHIDDVRTSEYKRFFASTKPSLVVAKIIQHHRITSPEQLETLLVRHHLGILI